MKFDLTAAKAYIGGFMSAGLGTTIANFGIGLVEASFHVDIPATYESVITMAFAYAVGHAAVYFTPNKSAV
jgi:hypothetical protein